ncbi:MAG: thioredoxin domain-containing protein [Bacteroidia bacterium]|nr:thioredoxin domain-containing protein [Bacteroidia bacterium]
MAHPPNALAAATSPYLLQHAHNPVAWQPWGDAALAQARQEGKLLIVSIGYSACHWCHVMERESFEDPEVAALMNAHYVSIKVDREERPDVDQIYMDAVQLMQGHGGWPLNCICLPDGRPLFGGTYFPRQRWLEVLQGVAAFWQQDPEKAEGYAADLTQAIRELDHIAPAAAPALSPAEVDKLFVHLGQRFDAHNGGVGQAPKFPVPSTWRFVLAYGAHRQSVLALGALHHTLAAMAAGGIYDHLGGGFARYATDPQWRVPHFEKMLYDNGQLVGLYALAYRQRPQPRYAEVIRQTVAFVARELRSPEGGFYSALDADSEGVEGKFYTWSAAEIERLLGPRAGLVKATYHVREEGNWEHTNILFTTESPEALAQQLGIAPEHYHAELAQAQAILFEARAQRIRPGLDDKLLTGWNGLMTAGLAEAYLALRDPELLALAQANDAFVEAHLAQGPALRRTAKRAPEGTYRAFFNAYLEDYAANLHALIGLYQCTFDERYLARAAERLGYVLTAFADPESPLLHFTPGDDAPLIARRKEYHDSVLPSSNASLAHALRTLGLYLDRADWVARAEAMLLAIWPQLERYPASFAHWCELALRHTCEEPEIVVAGPEAPALAQELTRRYWGPGLLSGAPTPDHRLPLVVGKYAAATPQVFVCRGKTCRLPVATAQEALAQLGL